MRNILLLAAAAAALAAPVCAQRAPVAPRRPPLAASADTNSAQAYMALGIENVAQRPQLAADAFYWAAEIDPGSADALYGRYTAQLMSDPRRLVDYWQGTRRVVRSPEVQRMDSLYFRALTMNPFLYRRFEGDVFRTYLRGLARKELESSEGGHSVPESVVDRWVTMTMQNGGPSLRAQDAYGRGNFEEALRLYDQAVREARRKSWLRTERARLFAHVQNDSAAAAEFGLAISDLRREDARDIVYLYESKALLEFGVGQLHERMGNHDAAREAYGRAIAEDLAFYPAHVRLGMLAMAAGDTATAVSEMSLAAEGGAVEPTVGYAYAAVLARAGRVDDAVASLQGVITRAPYYADPYLVLGALHDGQGRQAEALAAYRGFVARAARSHPRRAAAEGRIRDLEAAGAPSTGGR
ncbi:MAG TPA: tetratricopeptide repeat protein [Longimicrobium sp.]|uniref:tetratricopeptide repeat protein n=1 Tax=Longimicrobium sp. TaxID=2029185 RepID=UPI002ED9BA61